MRGMGGGDDGTNGGKEVARGAQGMGSMDPEKRQQMMQDRMDMMQMMMEQMMNQLQIMQGKVHGKMHGQ